MEEIIIADCACALALVFIIHPKFNYPHSTAQQIIYINVHQRAQNQNNVTMNEGY